MPVVGNVVKRRRKIKSGVLVNEKKRLDHICYRKLTVDRKILGRVDCVCVKVYVKGREYY